MPPRRQPARPTLVIFAKGARPGQVKTRLARDIGAIDATWWFRHQSAALIRRLSRDRRWRTVLAVTPDGAVSGGRARPSRLPRVGQGPGDLGRRMARFLRREPGTGISCGPVVIVGTDIPGLGPRHVAGAFRLLGRHGVVLGPAMDGGYWLIGAAPATRLPRDALAGVRWSSEYALADTLARLGSVTVGFAATLVDVDCGADLRAATPLRDVRG